MTHVYDSKTNLYYLQSRYYDPNTGRFLNADSFVSTGQGLLRCNMFAYCINCPVGYSDSSGNYCRKDAVAYAEVWYNEKNSQYYYYSGGDCANFVSQSLRAGGVQDTSEWYHNKSKKKLGEIILNPAAWISNKYRYNWSSSDSWRLAQKQYLYFSNPENGYINGEVIAISSVSDIMEVANCGGVQPGDLLYFSDDGTTMHHATIVSEVSDGMIFFSAHTSSQYNCPLSEKLGTETVFIIRINDDA